MKNISRIIIYIHSAVEGLPNVLIEAQYLGKPAVATIVFLLSIGLLKKGKLVM